MSANEIAVDDGKSNETQVMEEKTSADWISRLCYEHGLFCATHPKLVIVFTAMVVFSCR